MIEASFLEQYGIRLNEVEMSWAEFTDLLACVSGDTALGRIVAIRSETDKEVISKFNKHQRKIYDDWNGKSKRVGTIDDLFAFFKS